MNDHAGNGLQPYPGLQELSVQHLIDPSRSEWIARFSTAGCREEALARCFLIRLSGNHGSLWRYHQHYFHWSRRQSNLHIYPQPSVFSHNGSRFDGFHRGLLFSIFNNMSLAWNKVFR